MSRLALLLVHSRKIDLFCLLVKDIIKPHPSGEVARLVVTERTAGERSFFLPCCCFSAQPVGGKTCGLPRYNAAGANPCPAKWGIILGHIILTTLFFCRSNTVNMSLPQNQKPVFLP